ncbi:MAG: TMEM175 family protein [Streptosporangiaceae bacterium]
MTSPSDPTHEQRPPGPPAARPAGDAPEVEAKAAERVVFFSDAVVAIAITLLALALPLPAATDSTTNHQLLDVLGNSHNREAYLAFLISFVVIGNHWAVHRRMFRYVNRLNGTLIRLNMIWLLMMIITPFATRILTGNGAFGVRFTIYTLVQVIASTCLLLMSREIRDKDLMRPGAPESARHPENSHSVTLVVVFLISIPVAFAAGSWAFALWAAIPVLGRVPRRLRREPMARHG